MNFSGWDFGSVVEYIFTNNLVRIALALVLADVLSGIAVAVKNGNFRLAETGDFLRTKAIPYFLGAGALQLVILVLPEELSGIGPAAGALVWSFVVASMLGHLLDNLRQLGIPLPDVMTAAKKTPPLVLPLLLLVGLAAATPACNKLPANTAPDTYAAHVGGDLMQVVVDTKKVVIKARQQGVPITITDPAYDFLKQATDAADKAASAIEAYHAATSADLKAKFKTDADAAIAQVQGLLGKALGIEFPAGLAAEVLKLKNTIQEIVTSLRGQLAAARTHQGVLA